MACLPNITRSGCSCSTTFAKTFEIARGSSNESLSIKIALSAPNANAVLNCSCDSVLPTVIAITSSALLASLIRTASSKAISQNGLTDIFALFKSTFELSGIGLTLTL